MANRRMFARTVANSGRFLRLSQLARLLYYDLGMEADDDGFVEAFPRLRLCGLTEEHLTELADKNFITVLDWEDLVVHIDGWSENNLIRKDRYTPSRYLEKYPQYKAEPAPEQMTAQEPEQVKETALEEASSLVDQGLTQVRLGKVSKEEVSSDKENLVKNNLIQDNLNQENSGRAGGREAGSAPIQPAQTAENDKNESLTQEKPACIHISPVKSKLFDDFASDSRKPGDLEAEFNQKRKKSIDLLLNSEYFSKERAAPGKLLPV